LHDCRVCRRNWSLGLAGCLLRKLCAETAMDRVVASTCWECSAYCGSLITVNDAGRVSKIMPNPKQPISKGAFCVKGMRGLPVTWWTMLCDPWERC
jgi:anaerobic selenocysteine-containing dehydrogenase